MCGAIYLGNYNCVIAHAKHRTGMRCSDESYTTWSSALSWDLGTKTLAQHNLYFASNNLPKKYKKSLVVADKKRHFYQEVY